MLRAVSVRVPRTNLIIHRGGTDIFDQATKFIHTRGAFQEFRDPLPIFQWGQIPENLVEFPSVPRGRQPGP